MAVGAGSEMGYQGWMRVGEETTYGTSAATAASAFLEFNTESLKKTVEEFLIPTIHTTRAHYRRVQTNINVAGTIEYPFNPVDGILILKHAFGGSVTSATISAGVSYSHTFVTGDMNGEYTATSLSISAKRGSTSIFDYNGCKVTSLTLRAAIGEPVMMTAEIVGQNAATGTSATAVSFTTVSPFIFTQGLFQTGDTTASYSTEYIQSFELTLNNNMLVGNEVREIGTGTIREPRPDARDVTMNITQRFDTTTAYDRFLAGTRSAVKLTLDTGVTIPSGATTYSCYFEASHCYYNGDSPAIEGTGILTQTVPIRCMADTATGYELKGVLTNATADYET